MRRLIVLLALALAATVAAPASAHDVRIGDPDDVSSAVDLSLLTFTDHHRVKLCTWDPWSPRDLRGNNDYMDVRAELSSDEGWIISIFYKNGKLRVTGGHYGPLYSPMNLDWHRGNDRCITVRTKRSMKAARWRRLTAHSQYHGTKDRTDTLQH